MKNSGNMFFLTDPHRRNIWILAVCQGLFTCAISIDLTLTAITGYQLAVDKALATLPFALITVAGALVTLFASFLIEKLGRRLGFTLGAIAGILGGGVSFLAVTHHSFWFFCLGTSGVGVFQAFAQYYRLAAADSASIENKSKAISVVLTGGVVAAVLGPAIASWSKNLLPAAFLSGSYLVVSLLSFCTAFILLVFYKNIEMPKENADKYQQLPPRTAVSIISQPIFITAAANTVVGSVVMMLIMTAAPLAALICHHSIDDGATIIQWHLVGMYAPSFFAGKLISRFGPSSILFIGMFLNALCSLVAIQSIQLLAFNAALFFLGVGWNFMFVGGSTLLSRSYKPSERAKTQGIAEFLRYATTAIATLAAGPLLQRIGWSDLNWSILPILLLCFFITLKWSLSERNSNINSENKIKNPDLMVKNE